jgi:hypothetical protein
MCKEAIDSLGDGDFEVLLYVDTDDPQIKAYRSLASRKVKVFVEARLGYANFHRMVNFLAKKAKGEWLLLWNDDMRIIGDWTVPDATDKPQVLNFWDPNNQVNNLAPVISRKMYEIMGHFSLSTHCDSWVQDIANELGIHVPVHGAQVQHLRESLNDATKSQTQPVYATSSPEYDGLEMMKLREIDKEKLRENLL